MSDRPNAFLKARVVGTAILIESKQEYCPAFVFVGCSEPANVPAGSITTSLVIFSELFEGHVGLVVIAKPSSTMGNSTTAWPLRISVRDGKPWLGLDEDGLWTCREDRPGGVVESHLEVHIDGMWYRSGAAHKGKSGIDDPNLTCRYLVGKADESALLKAIQAADQKMPVKGRLASFEHRLRELEKRLGGQVQ